ncbi:MAG: guanylate kinase [Oscillospiraceae bacterium]|jgi:guanylate kinase|nr:guanylate kinase [Oscillospiraceae bacterium]
MNKNLNNKSLLVIFSGPSGVGKDTLLKEMKSLDPDLVVSISATTRRPRSGESHGVDYFFLTHKEFIKAINGDKFIEYVSYCGNLYGTPKKMIENFLDLGKIVILKIDVQGGLEIKKKMPESLSIFVAPPSSEILSRRLYNRDFENNKQTKKRLVRSEFEIKHSNMYNHKVINDDVKKCSKRILEIIYNHKESQ